MNKLLRAGFLLFALMLSAVMQDAQAARSFLWGGPGGREGGDFDPGDCAGSLAKAFPVSIYGEASCSGVDGALKAVAGGGSSYFSALFSKLNPYSGSTVPIFVSSSGSCTAGSSSDNVEVWGGYYEVATGHVVQLFPDPSPWSSKGCIVKVKDDISCYPHTGEAQVSPGVAKAYCTESTVETGEDGGADGAPTPQSSPYVPSGSGGGSGGSTGGGSTGGGDGSGGTSGGSGGGSTGGTGGGGTSGGGGTGTGGSGSGGSGSTGNGLCDTNPNLTICQNSSASATCEAVVCTGDAIQCETLRVAEAIRCKQLTDDGALNGSGLHGVGEAAVNGNDPMGPLLPSKENGGHIDMPGTLDASGWLGVGSCFPDKQFSVQGHSITISFSKACEYLLVFRYALMAAALLISFRMLSGAILRD